MDLEPSKCPWLPVQSETAIECLRVGDQAVPRVDQITVLGAVVSTSDPAGAAIRHRLQRAWKAWWAN